MTLETTALLTLAIFVAAVLYSSVGHAGASAYLAAMALFGIEPAIMRPTALCLNVVVASIAAVQFSRAGHFRWQLFWPFALASIPAAALGGSLTLPAAWYRPLVGAVLLFVAARLLTGRQPTATATVAPPAPGIAMGCGAAIGLLAGLTGTGGGIFLTPLLLVMGWAEPKQAAGVSAVFILVNSVAGLLGGRANWQALPDAIPVWAAAAVAGGVVGATAGSRRLATATLRRLLAVVLVIAGLKLIVAPG